MPDNAPSVNACPECGLPLPGPHRGICSQSVMRGGPGYGVPTGLRGESEDERVAANARAGMPCEPRCERFPLCLCGSAIPCQPHSVAGPTVVTRANLPKFDAVGLFVQWLAEAVSTLDMEFWIRLTYAKTYGTVVELEVHAVLEEQVAKRLWHVKDLNELLRDANGRGDVLKAEIQRTMIELRNRLKEEHHDGDTD